MHCSWQLSIDFESVDQNQRRPLISSKQQKAGSYYACITIYVHKHFCINRAVGPNSKLESHHMVEYTSMRLSCLFRSLPGSTNECYLPVIKLTKLNWPNVYQGGEKITRIGEQRTYLPISSLPLFLHLLLPPHFPCFITVI